MPLLSLHASIGSVYTLRCFSVRAPLVFVGWVRVQREGDVGHRTHEGFDAGELAVDLSEQAVGH